MNFLLSGYSPIRISAFEAASQHDGVSPVHHMLLDWSKHSHLANVSALARTLKFMGREDVVQVLNVASYSSGSQGHTQSQGHRQSANGQVAIDRSYPHQHGNVPYIENMYQSAGSMYFTTSQEHSNHA